MGGTKKRRRPWRARVTDGWKFDEEKGRAVQKFRVLGYFATKKEALIALAEYHKAPAAAGTAHITFAYVYRLWCERNHPAMTTAVAKGYDTVFRHSAPLHALKMSEIRTEHLQRVLDAQETGFGVQSRLKTLWSGIFRLAIELDIVQKDYADFVRLNRGRGEKIERKPFTKAQIATLWENLGKAEGVEVALILIYTGLRAAELLSIERGHVHLAERWIDLHGTKTKAARRIVPIHRAIVPLLERRLGGARLMEVDGRQMGYSYLLRSVWNPCIVDWLGFEGMTPHGARHTAASLMTEAGIDERLVRKILGHSTGSVTERYVHPDREALIEAIDMIEV